MNNNLFNSSNNRKQLSDTRECGKKKKFDFNQKKNNTIKSLSDVECFLRDFHKFKKCIKLFKIIK